MEEHTYTIAELFERLKNDESWESDPEIRKNLANDFYMQIHGM